MAELIVSMTALEKRIFPASNFIFIALKNPKSKEQCYCPSTRDYYASLHIGRITSIKSLVMALPKVTFNSLYFFLVQIFISSWLHPGFLESLD